jgi:cell fate (sporulation/competence/biofilm development) regulator YlbF (YheA/YmcA/DUF963 family)
VIPATAEPQNRLMEEDRRKVQNYTIASTVAQQFKQLREVYNTAKNGAQMVSSEQLYPLQAEDFAITGRQAAVPTHLRLLIPAGLPAGYS